MPVGKATGWRVAATLEDRGGRVIVTALEVTADGEPRPPGLTGDHLRRIPLGKAPMSLFDADDSRRAVWGSGLIDEETRRRMKAQSKLRQGKTRDDDWHARVAWDYLAAFRQDSRRPLVILAQEYQRRGMKTATVDRVRSWVHRARTQGWLTKSSQGRSGGDPTEKLKDWMKSHPAGREVDE